MDDDGLGDVRVARARKELADREYREAIDEYVRLRGRGAYADLARLLGVSRQAVRQTVEGGKK